VIDSGCAAASAILVRDCDRHAGKSSSKSSSCSGVRVAPSVEPTVDDVVAHFGEIRGEGTAANELDGEALVWGLQSFAPRLKPLLALQNRG
jgi:hypothetical protein